MIRCGLTIPNFTYPGVAPDELFERVAAIATTAESSGFDTVMVMDHFYQLPGNGPPEHEMLEAYTLLGAIAALTTTVNVGTLVTGVTYRNPAILAKTVTTLDVISKGRAFLGIGAAWYQLEHEALGVVYPPITERFERLHDAVRICRAMFRGERPTIAGQHYHTVDAINSPAPIRDGGPPILIGGAGERKSLRLVAEYADVANMPTTLAELPRKLEALASHCADVGRDIATITKTGLGQLVLGRTHEEAVAKRDARLAAVGMPWGSLDDATRAAVTNRMFVGDADEVGEQIGAFLAAGLDGMCFNLAGQEHDLEAIAFAGEVVTTATKAAGK